MSQIWQKTMFDNQIRDIGTKYLGKGLSKLIKLTYLRLDLEKF